jgi:hypothetical protein
VSYVSAYAIAIADTWEQKTITIAAPTTGTFSTTNTKAIQLAFTNSMGSNYTSSGNDAWQSESKLGATGTQVALTDTLNSTWQVTGVQLEVGSSATDFEHLQYGTQLALCQRYCYTRGAESAYEWLGTGPSQGSGGMTIYVFPCTVMRAGPTLTYGTVSHYRAWYDNSWGAVTGISLNQSTNESIGVDITRTSLTGMCAVGMNGSTASKLIFTAEL